MYGIYNSPIRNAQEWQVDWTLLFSQLTHNPKLGLYWIETQTPSCCWVIMSSFSIQTYLLISQSSRKNGRRCFHCPSVHVTSLEVPWFSASKGTGLKSTSTRRLTWLPSYRLNWSRVLSTLSFRAGANGNICRTKERIRKREPDFAFCRDCRSWEGEVLEFSNKHKHPPNVSS